MLIVPEMGPFDWLQQTIPLLISVTLWTIQFIFGGKQMLATKVISKFRRTYYALINRLALYKYMRWTFTLILVLLYIETVQSSSYDIATYLIGFYLLQLLIGYFTPKGVIDDDVDAQEAESLYHFEDELRGQSKETAIIFQDLKHDNDKPLARTLSQIDIWERATFAFVLGLVCTYFKMIQIDVFWPLLLVYFVVLACYTIQKVLKTMEKYKYGLSDFQKQPF